MRYGSVCAGIEAATQAWRPLGWKPSFYSEIAAFPRAVLRHHYPETPLHGDFTTIEAGEYEPIDLLVGGTPCQSFSLAGLRQGLADERGNLALEYILLADRLRPRWLVWENVPGVFSSRPGDPPDEDVDDRPLRGHNGGPPLDGERLPPGSDFAAFLSGLARWEIPIPPGGWKNSGVVAPAPVDGAYGLAWRVLDAQYAGVPQRRRRVFVVGYLGDWRRPAAALFERESLSGNAPPRRNSTQAPPGYAHAGLTSDDLDAMIAPTLSAGGNGRNPLDEPLVAVFPITGDALRGAGEALTPSPDAEGRIRLRNPGLGIGEDGDPAATLQASGPGAIAFALRGREGGAMPEVSGDKVGALRASSGGSTRDYVAFSLAPASGVDGGISAVPVEVANTLTGTAEAAKNGRGLHFVQSAGVRRLTPRECERLQGFPDDFTLIPWRKGLAPDGPRYKALGNSMAVPVMRWIGERIAMVEELV